MNIPTTTDTDLLQHARRLRAALRDGQAETERRTYPSAQMHERFREAGFYRMLLPRRYGGLECGVATFYRVVTELARGCPSSGWCFALSAAHVLQVASFFEPSAQDRLLGGGEFIAAARDAPQGTARQVDGGYVIEGRWDYCSGIPHSTHLIAAAHVAGHEHGEYEQFGGGQVLFALSRSGWEIIEEWGAVLGMRGSGSHGVRVAGAFVPADQVLHLNLLDVDVEGGTPGLRLHDNPMYAGRQLGFFGGELAALAVGTARAMVDEYERLITSTRTTFHPRVERSAHHDYRRVLGDALATVDAAEAVVQQVGLLFHEHSRRQADGIAPFTLEKDYRLDRMAARAGELAWEAADLLVRTSGSGAMRDGQRMQRYLRDLTMYRTHQVSSHRAQMAETLGRVRLEVRA